MRKRTGSKIFVFGIVKRFFAIFLFSAVLVGTGYTGLSSVQAAASPSRIVAYQGRLLNSNGVPVSDATLPMIFTLYTALSGGTCVWSNNSASCTSPATRTVSLTSGLFSENLGDTTASYAAINSSVFSDNASIYLEIIVNGETLTPRKLMSASPYALNTDSLDGFDTTQVGATSAMIPALSSSGNLVITGDPTGSLVNQGSLYVNPAGASTDDVLFGIADGGSGLFTVDKEGDVSISGALTIGGDIIATSTGTFSASIGGADRVSLFNATLSGTSGNNLSTLTNVNLFSNFAYSGIEGTGDTAHSVMASKGQLNIDGSSATITTGFGIEGILSNASTNASLLESGGYLSGVVGLAEHTGALTTIGDMRGMYGVVQSGAGTITNAYGVYGDISVTGSGAMTNSYSLYGSNINKGTTRYGVFANASGGTTNYAGYFAGSRVQIDADSTPDTPGTATGAGDLFVASDIENDGSAVFGDTTGTDTFSFTSAATTGTVLHLTTDSLTSGGALVVTRADGAGAFDANLLTLIQNDVSDGYGAVAYISNAATVHSAGLHVVQASTSAPTVSDSAARAVLIDVQEVGSSDDAFVLRSDTTNGLGADVEFRITTQGDTFMDGVMTSASVAVGGADYAEFFQTTDSALSGTQLTCQAGANTVKRCEAGNTAAMGVVSTNPGLMGNVLTGDPTTMFSDTDYRLVGMVGQIETAVTAVAESIAVGDPITTSSTMAGYGAKAHGPVRIIGFALESLSSGTGTIRVLVQPQWYGGDVLTRSGSATQVAGSLAIASTTVATVSAVAVNSASLQLRGSAWDAGSAHEVSMSMQTSVNAINDYRLSVMNSSGTEVAVVNNMGDLAIAGKFYPSDRGVSQNSKYIYYDGSSGSGGDFMRTNASGWGTGSYDFAEMFPSPDSLVAGEVVVFGDASQQVKRSGGETYNPKIAGIVSTRPGFLAGTNTPGSVPIALAGRVPTLVSTENGPISIGDPVTTSSHPGYAMKATESGPIVGYAAEAFSGSMGSIVVYVNVSYYSGAPVEEGPATANTISHLAEDIENFDTAGVLNLNGGRLLAIGSMTSVSGAWQLSETGDLVTSGRLVQLVRGNDGTNVETYPTTSRDMTVQLTGTASLDHGAAIVHFADIDSSFTNIIDSNPSYRVLVTPYGATGTLYVTNRTVDGFSIAESGAASNGVSVDWMVIAYRRDHAPVTTPTVIPVVDPIIDSIVTGGSGDAVSDPMVDSVVPIPEASQITDVPVDEPVVPSDSESVPDAIVEAAPVPDPGSAEPAADAPSAESAVSSDSVTVSDFGSSAPESSPSSDSVAQ